MATRRVAAAVLAVALVSGVVACSSDDDAPDAPEPATITFPEVDLEVDVPARLADLTYAMGESEEGQPALYFSTEELASVGGPTCEAGAEAAVSPYPIGQVVVSEETPEHVREEAKENPEENLGRFVTQAGDYYLYYLAPPEEDCVSDNPEAAKLQQELTVQLRSALESMRLTE